MMAKYFAAALILGGLSQASAGVISPLCKEVTKAKAQEILTGKHIACPILPNYTLYNYPGAGSRFAKVITYYFQCSGGEPRQLVVVYDETDPACAIGNAWIGDEG